MHTNKEKRGGPGSAIGSHHIPQTQRKTTGVAGSPSGPPHLGGADLVGYAAHAFKDFSISTLTFNSHLVVVLNVYERF